MSTSKRNQYRVGKTKVTRAPWEEDRYIYDIKSGNDSLFSGVFWVAVIQVIFGIVFFIWFYNKRHILKYQSTFIYYTYKN